MADAHAGAGDDASLLAFLAAVPTLGDALLIAGDLFEFWFAWRTAVPRRGFAVAAALLRLAEGVPVYLLGGNHDRWGHGFWGDQRGVMWAPDELRLVVGSRPVLALHGDGLTEGSRRARLIRRAVAHPATTGAVRLLHPDLILPLVARLAPRLKSESDPASRAGARDRQVAWAEKRLAAEPALGALIMAHTHLPHVAELRSGQILLNPGAWCEGGAFATLDAGGAELRRFSPAGPPRPSGDGNR